MNTRIASVTGRRVWDSRGRPTVEVEIGLSGGALGRSIAPAGASTGSGEAVDLRDGGTAFGGYDVQAALAAVNGEIAGLLAGGEAMDQAGLDAALIALDGTVNKGRLGGNAIVATSMAIAHAAAAARGLPLWRHLAEGRGEFFLPLPEIQIFGGGAHAGRRVDVQDFMVIAVGAADYAQSLEWTAEVYRAAGALMGEAGLLAGVADEGGYWPAFDGNEKALEFLLRAIERAGLHPRSGCGDLARHRGLELRPRRAVHARPRCPSYRLRWPVGDPARLACAVPHRLDRGSARRGRPRRDAAVYPRGRRPHRSGGGRFHLYQRGTHRARAGIRRVQHGADQAEPGRHADRDPRRARMPPARPAGKASCRPVRAKPRTSPSFIWPWAGARSNSR